MNSKINLLIQIGEQELRKALREVVRCRLESPEEKKHAIRILCDIVLEEGQHEAEYGFKMENLRMETVEDDSDEQSDRPPDNSGP